MQFFDLHCDTLYRSLKENQNLYKNQFHISIERGKKYTSWVQCFAIWIPDELRGEEAISLFREAAGKLEKQISLYEQFMSQCKTKEELIKTVESGKCAAILTLEGGAALGGRIEELLEMYQFGVKIITLTWNGTNEIGDGAEVIHAKGLTRFGQQVVEKMNELGMIIDVSHASDRLFYDVAEYTNKPIIATHSNSRRICKQKRNLTDEQFGIIQSTGGIVGINFCKHFLNIYDEAGFSDILKHVDYFLSLGGEKTVCIGSDFDGTDMPKGITGIESMESLYEYFLKKNYKEQLVEDIFFNNAYQFFMRN